MPRKVSCVAVLLACLMLALFYINPQGMLAQSQSQPFSTQVVAPTVSTPAPLSNAQRALSHVSQLTHIPVGRLLLADTFTQELGLSQRTLWWGWVLDRKERSLYEVIVETGTGIIVNSQEMESLWEAERVAYRARYGQRILEQIAQQASVSVASLLLVNDALASYPLTGRIFWQVKILDTKTARLYHLALGSDGAEVDPAALQEAEFKAHRARYRQLEPELYYRLQAVESDELVPVLIWARHVDDKWVDAQLALRHPELAKDHRFASGRAIHSDGSPVQLESVLFERVRADYNDLLDQAHLVAEQPVVDFLKALGYQATPLELFPGVYANLQEHHSGIGQHLN